ncbi:hypothetical protein CcaCcLH18_09234 [Colletotrichum camelliae]|nr:hypothetical protein CcaCcLH18_09234 [Colletotrichum camelliae]
MPHAMGLKIAILINIDGIDNQKPMKAAFRDMLERISPESIFDFYDPINAQVYPDVSKYDLIVLSGGNVFVMDEIPWVLKMRDFLKSTVASHPEKKIMGICWGHQIINVALGGTAKEMSSADVGVHTIPLTERGSEFFGDSLLKSGQINIQQFHKRDIDTPAEGFLPLAENNEAFVNTTNTIITFQGHPEMTVEWGSAAAASYPAYIALTGYSMEEIQEHIRRPADGEAVWRRVLKWVDE